jgi:long-chain acyl-CoA synthetase
MIPIKPIDPSMTLVHHFLERSARLFPDKVAVVHGKTRVTYSEINNRANNLAHYLVSVGVLKGDRVALLMENCIEYVVSYYGVLKTGAVAVPLNSDLKPEGLRYAISDLEAKILISNSRFEKVISASNLADVGLTHLITKTVEGLRTASLEVKGIVPPQASSLQPPTISDFDLITSSPPVVVDYQLSAISYQISPSDLASIIYTSGSTGGPKGVMLSHRNIVDNTFSICQYLNLTENDIQMVVLPFFYVMGKSLLNTHFAVGGTIVINNQFAFPAAIINEMIREKVTGFSGVPSTFAYLIHRSPLASMRGQLTSLRYVSQAGGHMARTVKERLRQTLPDHTEIFIMYGATEAAARLSYLEPSSFADKIGSIGRAIPGVELQDRKSVV